MSVREGGVSGMDGVEWILTILNRSVGLFVRSVFRS